MRSLLFSYYSDFKVIYGIYAGILVGLIICKFWLIPSGSESSSLNAGLVNGIFVSAISMIVITSNSELLKKFSFPVNRNMLVLSHIILILAVPLIMLLTSCGLFLLESLAARLIISADTRFFYSWVITKSSFLVGFMASYMTMVCITAIVWMVFAWFYRYKAAISVLGGTFLVALLFLDSFQESFFRFVEGIFFTSSPGLLFLKLAAITLASFVLGYIPIKRMEVRK